MPVELKMLGWSVALGLVYILLATLGSVVQRGLAWNTSNRDVDPGPFTGAIARMDRAMRNFLETFALFAAAVIVVVLAQRTNASTALGVQLYFWARVVYLPVYAFGIPYLRTLVWTVSVIGIVSVLTALF